MNFWSSFDKIVGALQTGGTQLVDRLQQLVQSVGEARRNVAFTVAMIALSAKMAKADGVVTHDEVVAFYDLFEMPAGEERNVSRLFQLAQQDVAGFETYASKLSVLFAEDETTRTDVLDGLFYIAKADGVIHEREIAYLSRISEIFGIDAIGFSQVKARHIRGDGDPYLVLGIDMAASDEDVRSSYRKQVRETHPDQLIGRGVPEEFVKIASDKLAALNKAYEQICAERRI